MAPDDLAESLRRFALTYPEAHLNSPWPGHLDLAVRDKTFAARDAWIDESYRPQAPKKLVKSVGGGGTA